MFIESVPRSTKPRRRVEVVACAHVMHRAGKEGMRQRRIKARAVVQRKRRVLAVLDAQHRPARAGSIDELTHFQVGLTGRQNNSASSPSPSTIHSISHGRSASM